MRDTDARDADASPPDPMVELLTRCLLAADPEAELAVAMREHPEQAERLRDGYDLLRRANLTGGENGAPARLGRFRLLRQLGAGGMGVVHLAEEEPLGRPVALKMVRPEMLHFASSRARFLREIAAVAALQHPGIVPIYSFGDEGGVPFYAMAHVAGRTLADLIAQLRDRGAPPDAAALHQPGRDWTTACFAVTLAVAEALGHAHTRGVLHRDVKPSNIMLAEDGRALLIDFGLCRIAGDDSLTRTGVQPGSLAYMSPEQVRGEPVDARSDVWSLGTTLYELLTLQPAFGGATEQETRDSILRGHPADVRRTGSGVPWDAAIVLATAMAPELSRRYASMRAFADDLRAFVEHRAIQARRPGVALRLRRYGQRRPAVATALALGALLVVTLPTALYLQERSARAGLLREAETAKAAVTFLEDLFAECEPHRARGATVTARAILDRGVQRVRRELHDQPAVQAALLEAMGSAYLNLGLFEPAAPLLDDARRLRGTPGVGAPSLHRVLHLQARLASARGDDALAESTWQQVLAALPPMHGPDGLAAAEVNLQLAHALWRQDQVARAEQLMNDAVAAVRRLAGGDDVRLGRALLAQGIFLQEREDPLRAEPVLIEAERRLAAALPADHPELIAARCDLARNQRVVGNDDAAAKLLADAERAAVALFDPSHPQLAMVREELAALALDGDRPADAVAPLQSAIASYRAIYPSPNHVLARALTAQCRLRTSLGELRTAEADAREALAQYELLYPQGHLDMAAALSCLSMVQTEAGNLGEAAALARRSLAVQDRIGQRRTAIRALTSAHLGYALAFDGDFFEAERLARDAVAAVERTRVEPAVALRVRCYLAEILCLQRRGADAAVEVAILKQQAAPRGPAWQGWVWFLQGWAEELQRDYENADRSLREALAVRTRVHGARHPLTGIVLGELGVVLANRSALPEAVDALQTAVDIRREHGGAGDVHLNLPLLNLATVEMMRGRNAEATAAGEEVLDALRGRVGRGNQMALGTVKLLLRLSRSIEDLTARRDKLTALRTFAVTVLAPDDAVLQALDKALQAAGG